MSTLLAVALISHIVLGIIALGALHLAFMHIMRRNPPWGIITFGAWVAVLAFLLSWATSAYYYVTYYGVAVKPRIVEGSYPWAHTVFMEAKEHIFLIVPFLAITVLFGVYALRYTENSPLKLALTVLLATALALGAFVAISGVIVSGAVR